MAKQNSPKVITRKHMARLERERRQINLIRGIALAGIVIVVGLLAYGYLKLNVLALRLASLNSMFEAFWASRGLAVQAAVAPTK